MKDIYYSSDWYRPPLVWGCHYRLVNKRTFGVLKISRFKWYYSGVSDYGFYPNYLFKPRAWYRWLRLVKEE